MVSHAFVGAFLLKPVFWVAVAFVIFFVLFGAKVWGALAGMLDKRAATIRLELEEAARLRREAEAMLLDARTRREQALGEAEAMLRSAEAEAKRVAEQARADAQAAGERRERMALDRIAAAEKAALNDVRIAAVEVAAEAAQQVIARGLTDEQDAALIDRAIAGLPAALRAA